MNTSTDAETYAIIGAAMAVHNELGCVFLEAVYQEALSCEFKEKQIPFSREDKLPIIYKNKMLDLYYRADFICYNSIVVELKALNKITEIEIFQVINYLKASSKKRGLLINFGAKSLEYKRIVLKY